MSRAAFKPNMLVHRLVALLTFASGHHICLGDAGSKRVKAPRPLPPPPATAPLYRQLLGPRPSERQQRWDSISHFALHQEWDLYGLGAPATDWWPPFYLRRRSALREVVAAGGIVVALAGEGPPREQTVCTPGPAAVAR